ncbi:MAG: hypothetical protein NT154_01320 [Verrucomicrobia bacterium]|nr:hypothetical protein [Verrucomicrobiota bacterium]
MSKPIPLPWCNCPQKEHSPRNTFMVRPSTPAQRFAAATGFWPSAFAPCSNIYRHDKTTTTKKGEQHSVSRQKERLELAVFFNGASPRGHGEAFGYQGGIDEGVSARLCYP